ncbi:glycoside hydrolase [Massariosphaeria phaeospora]|uniref:Glycoside hydrolase n=1 Tax=Massariosphaeria phaeospora TaxID=100035 RepID=A0A7C8IHF6_9PLEO|nr:glycoside hydrolase [Massariosphaeria phaeospora]
MIGEIHDEHTRQDIIDAKSVGLDAFAMNFNKFASWSENTVERLFKNADELGFGLFFSFDMAPGYFTDPNQYATYLRKYTDRTSYYKHNGKPLVSTFGGEKVSDTQWSTFKGTVGDVVIIPGFYATPASTEVFDSRPSIDGIFNWNSWSLPSAGRTTVSTKDDETYMSAASTAKKLFMLGISPMQFKHIDGSQNWYRRAEDNLEYRFAQALELQPDMLQLQSWNDAGESHYMGRLWPEPMTNSPIHTYVDGYDHTGYWQVLPAFIQAWKRGDKTTAGMVPTNGKSVQGTFWHHTLLTGADCTADPIGKPVEIENIEDAVTGIVLVAKGKTGLVAEIKSGGKQLGKLVLVEGYNKFKFTGLTTGKVTLEVWEGSTMVAGGYGALEVSNSAEVCNYNFQVVGFPAAE